MDQALTLINRVNVKYGVNRVEQRQVWANVATIDLEIGKSVSSISIFDGIVKQITDQ